MARSAVAAAAADLGNAAGAADAGAGVLLGLRGSADCAAAAAVRSAACLTPPRFLKGRMPSRLNRRFVAFRRAFLLARGLSVAVSSSSSPAPS